ncbi:MAG: transcriptional repressor LexA [Defluviitaleaceae bacterium]|nr:transcriptional repressor LexA [Defluviitaleaceae bacterium]
MAKQITKKQQAVLDYLKQEIRNTGCPPSIREICAQMGLKSTSSAHLYLENLEKRGYIQRFKSKNRSLKILEPGFYGNSSLNETVNVPVLGKVTAGVPIFAQEEYEEVFPMPTSMVGNSRCFMLRVSGESMIEAGICDKDLVLIKEQQTATNGDIVLALLEEEATIKRFFKDGKKIKLQAENPLFEPIIVDDVKIIGKVVGLYRNF